MSDFLAIPTDLDTDEVNGLYHHIVHAVDEWVARDGRQPHARPTITALLADVCTILQGAPEHVRASMTEEAFHVLIINSGADPADVFAAQKRRSEARLMMAEPQGSA